MDYITAEQFLKQPEEAQKLLIDWWKPKVVDLYVFDVYGIASLEIVTAFKETNGNKYILPFKGHNIWEEKKNCIPLFTETQLRHFIEEKIGGKIDLEYLNKNEKGYKGYTISLWKIENYSKQIRSFGDLGQDILQAYWEVACKIAKEC